MKKVEWLADPGVENLLREKGLDWTVVTSHLRKVNFQSKKFNSVGRSDGDKVNVNAANFYSIKVKQGVAFPRLVFRNLADHRYDFGVLGGFHRLYAFDANDIDEVEAYAVTIEDPQLIYDLPFLLNTLNGVPPTRDQRLQQAFGKILKFGTAARDAAADFGIPENTLTQYARAETTRLRLGNYGINANGMKQGMLDKLTKLADNDTLFTAVGRLLSNYPMRVDDAAEFISEVQRARSEPGGMEVITRWTAKMAEIKHAQATAKRRPKHVVYDQLKRHLTQLSALLAVDKCRSVTQLQIPGPEQYKEVGRQAAFVCKRLNTLLKTKDED